MNRKHVFQAFNFQDQSVLNQKIETITAVQFDAFVLDRQRNLALKGDVAETQFVAETFFVG
jgi:hypothetical protein